MVQKITQHINRLQLLIMVVVLAVANVALIESASAATLTQTSVAETNMLTAGAGSLGVSFKPATTSATSVTLVFNGWTGTGGTGTLNSSATFVNGCALFGGMAGSNLTSTPTVTITASTGTIALTGLTGMGTSNYCFTLTNGVTANPTAAGSTSVAVNTNSDSTTASIAVVSNDQYTVSASVAPTFTMSLPSTADTFASSLSAAAENISNGVTATVSTNAASGWYLWAKDSNAGLKSATQGNTIASVPTAANFNFSTPGTSIGTEKYGLGVLSGGATTAYNDTGHTGAGLSSSIFNAIATGTGPANNNAVSIKEHADIAATTNAASDYTDVITIVGAGNF